MLPRTFLRAILMVVFTPFAAIAQARLVGSVVDSETGRPVANASVIVKGMKDPVSADSMGQFSIDKLPDEDVTLQIRRLGYEPGQFRFRVPASGTATKTFSLDFTGQKMAAVEVTARAEQLMSRYTDFERRRQRGEGAFFRWDDLNKGSYSSIGDALRTVRGVRVQCNQQTFECAVRLARSPTCEVVWYIDGQEARGFNENTPIRDVYGMEIYRGAGEVPGEYAGSNAACGVILVWTKSRPFRTTP